MEEIVRRSPEPEIDVARVLDPRGWSRDLAIIGASSSSIVPALSGASVEYSLAACVIGMLLGFLLGRAVPLLLSSRVRRYPLFILALAGAGLGANWGAATAALAALTLGSSFLWSVELGATVCLIQLGWFWIPAVWLRSRGKLTWEMVLLAIAACPLLAIALAR